MSDTQTAPAEQHNILRGAVLATAGLAGAALLAPREARAAGPTSHLTLFFTTDPHIAGTTSVAIPGTGDTKVLNFALALETLEAELYRQAYTRLTGTTPDGSAPVDQFGNTITAVGGVSLTDADAAYIKEFSVVEAQHRDFLTTALGGNWVTAAGAKVDFGINALDRKGVVSLVYAAELTGVSAYLGGALVLTPGSQNLTYAAAILGTEARHTAAIAIVLNGPLFNETPKVETAPLPSENAGKNSPLTPDQILYQGGTIPFPGGTIPTGGHINPVSGPNGFVVV